MLLASREKKASLIGNIPGSFCQSLLLIFSFMLLINIILTGVLPDNLIFKDPQWHPYSVELLASMSFSEYYSPFLTLTYYYPPTRQEIKVGGKE